MTNRESVVISAYTGFMIQNDFSKVHEYIEEILERPVFTHEMASDKFIKKFKKNQKKNLLK